MCTGAYVVPCYYALKKTFHNFNDAHLRAVFKALIDDIGYEGIFDADFLVDENGQLYFLEINFRNSAFSYAATKLGINIPLIWADYMLQADYEENSVNIPDDYTVIAEVADFSQRVIKNKMLSVFGWLKELRKADCLLVWNKKDKKPCFSYWWGIVRLVIRKRLGGKRKCAKVG